VGDIDASPADQYRLNHKIIGFISDMGKPNPSISTVSIEGEILDELQPFPQRDPNL